MLRMDKSVSKEDRMKRINEVLHDVILSFFHFSKLFYKFNSFSSI